MGMFLLVPISSLKNLTRRCLVVVGAPAVAAGRCAEVGVEVRARGQRDAVGGLADEGGLLDGGDFRDRVLGVEVVVEERLALGGLLHRLLADERLAGGELCRDGGGDGGLGGEGRGGRLRLGERGLRLGELRLEGDDLRRLGGRLRRGGAEVHRARRDRLRAAQGGERLLFRPQRREGVAGQHPHAARRRRVRRLERHLRLGALRRRRLRLAAPRVARLQLRAEARRVADGVAVAALVFQQLRAAHLALGARRVLDEVARELRLGQPLCAAKGAELGVFLGGNLGRH